MVQQGKNQITSADVDSLTKKLAEFSTTLNEKEQTALMGVLELAGKMYEGTDPQRAPKRKLTLVRERIRELNMWDRLIETQGWSLWTCNGKPDPGDPIEKFK